MPTSSLRLATPTETPAHSLWTKALSTLNAELRQRLDLSSAKRRDILTQALEEAEAKRRSCIQKCSQFKKPSGETIVLRDVMEKIIVWIEKFLAVGNAAMQYDPLHAAPAWAAFRFVLQLAVNEIEVFGETIDNLQTLSYLITRYVILEELYLQRNSAARDKLEDMVVRLYVKILTFLGKARAYFELSASSSCLVVLLETCLIDDFRAAA